MFVFCVCVNNRRVVKYIRKKEMQADTEKSQ